MKISSYTLILQLILLGFALASFSLLKVKFEQYELASHRQQNLQSHINAIYHSETLLNQWYATIDLLFNDRQNHLAEDINHQTRHILKRLSLLEQNLLPQAQLAQLQQRISSESRNIQRIAFDSAADHHAWHNQLNHSKSNNGKISNLLSQIKIDIAQQYANAHHNSLIKRHALKLHAVLLLTGYIITLLIAAIQINRIVNKRRQNKQEENLLAIEHSAAQRLNQLLDNINLAIITIDNQGLITRANPAASYLFKQPAKQLIHLPITRLLPALDIHSKGFKKNLTTAIATPFDAKVGHKLQRVALGGSKLEPIATVPGATDTAQITLFLHPLTH